MLNRVLHTDQNGRWWRKPLICLGGGGFWQGDPPLGFSVEAARRRLDALAFVRRRPPARPRGWKASLHSRYAGMRFRYVSQCGLQLPG